MQNNSKKIFSFFASHRGLLKVSGFAIAMMYCISGLLLLREGIGIVRSTHEITILQQNPSLLPVLLSCLPVLVLVFITMFIIVIVAISSAFIVLKIEYRLERKDSVEMGFLLPPWTSLNDTLRFMLIGAWLAGLLASILFFIDPLHDSHMIVQLGVYVLAILQTFHVILVRNVFPGIE